MRLASYSGFFFQSGIGNGHVILEVRTLDVDLLPLIDYKSYDFGDHAQRHGYELSPVCFSG